MELKNTWRQYFVTHKDNAVLNQNQSALKLAWSINSSLDSRLEFFGVNPYIVVLILFSKNQIKSNRKSLKTSRNERLITRNPSANG